MINKGNFLHRIRQTTSAMENGQRTWRELVLPS